MTSTANIYDEFIRDVRNADPLKFRRDWVWSFDNRPKIKNVIFNEPATIVIWSDNTKTVVKCQKGDTYSKEVGLALCIAKKHLGNKSNFNNEFKKWIPEEESPTDEKPLQTVTEMREYIKNYCHYRLHGNCHKCPIDHLPHHRFGFCFSRACTDDEIIENYKVIKEWEAEHGETMR